MKSKIFFLFLTTFIASVGTFAQSNIRQRHNGDASWNSFLDNNMVTITEAPEKATDCPVLVTGSANTNLPNVTSLANASYITPDAVETKTYRWFDTNFVVTVYSVKRLETLYKREMANNKAKK